MNFKFYRKKKIFTFISGIIFILGGKWMQQDFYPIKTFHLLQFWVISKENRIYIRVEFTRKKCKATFLLYCFHTACALHIFALYNLLCPGISFYRKSKINIKRKPNYEIGWFHNWPMIISRRLYAFHFTNDDFPL